MADKLKAINFLRPKLKLGRMVGMDQIDPYVALRSGVSRGGIMQIVNELSDAVLFFARDGRSVKIKGLGRFTPKIGLDGTLAFNVCIDSLLQKRIDDEGLFKGQILNRDNIGKSSDELITLWNELHPEDPVA